MQTSEKLEKPENSLAVFQEISYLYSILKPLEQFEKLKKPKYLVRK